MMIGRLRGTLVEVGDEEALIDVMGVGYIVRCGARTLGRMPPLGEEVVVQVDSQTREDGTRLYGFLTHDDRSAFRTLQAIQGVGPKAALSVLDILPPADLAQAVIREDKAAVARANGVGPKLALRIVTELKGKPLGGGTLNLPAHGSAVAAPPAPSVSGEATAALMGLGVAEAVARRSVDAAMQALGPDAALPAVIKAALKDLGR